MIDSKMTTTKKKPNNGAGSLKDKVNSRRIVAAAEPRETEVPLRLNNSLFSF